MLRLVRKIALHKRNFSARRLGGSNLVTAGFWCTSTEFKQAKLPKSKGKGKEGKKAKLTMEEKKELRKKKREAKRAEKKRRLLEKLRGFQLEESKVMPALAVAEREYRVVIAATCSELLQNQGRKEENDRESIIKANRSYVQFDLELP